MTGGFMRQRAATVAAAVDLTKLDKWVPAVPEFRNQRMISPHVDEIPNDPIGTLFRPGLRGFNATDKHYVHGVCQNMFNNSRRWSAIRSARRPSTAATSIRRHTTRLGRRYAVGAKLSSKVPRASTLDPLGRPEMAAPFFAYTAWG
jgi:hypothetical protein